MRFAKQAVGTGAAAMDIIRIVAQIGSGLTLRLRTNMDGVMMGTKVQTEDHGGLGINRPNLESRMTCSQLRNQKRLSRSFLRGPLWRHLIVLAAVTGLAVASRSVGKPHYSRVLRETAQKASQIQSARIGARWSGLTYNRASEAQTSEAFLDKIDWRSLNLSEIQRHNLERRIRQLLTYLQEPSFERYWELKTSGCSYHFELSPRAKIALTRSPLNPVANLVQPRDVAKAVWDYVSTGGTPVRIRELRIDDVSAACAEDNSVDALLKGKVAKGFTTAFDAIDAGFEYHARPASKAFLHLSFFVKVDSGKAGPVYASFVWLEPDQQWALSKLVTDVLLDLSAIPG